jgi:hypothetical protein
MKKEVILAVAVGFILGLIITFAIWTANKGLNSIANKPPTPTPTASVSPSPSSNLQPTTNNLQLTITSPDNEILVTKDTITLTGKTSPQAAVAITTAGGQDIVIADSTGAFTEDIKLEGGYNQITATAYDSDGNTAKANLLVTYTTSKI